MNEARINHKNIALYFAAVVLLTAIGCTAMPSKLSNPFSRENKAKSPARMVDVWNTYVQTNPDGGGPPLRGLAGRIVFYPETKSKSKKQPEAICVDGTLSVFLFDAATTDPQHTKPLKQYVFKADALPYHYSFKKPMGHGYNIFLPIDEYGGSEKTLSVIVRFDDDVEKGRLVMTQPVTTILQGTSPLPNSPDGGTRQLTGSDARQHSFTPALYRDVASTPSETSTAWSRDGVVWNGTTPSESSIVSTSRESRSRIVGAIPLTPRDAERFGRVAEFPTSLATSNTTANNTVTTNTPNPLVWSNADTTTNIAGVNETIAPFASQQQLAPDYPTLWSPSVKIPFSDAYRQPESPGVYPDVHYREQR